MILKVLTDTLKVDRRRNIVFPKMVSIADARQHQQLRRIDDAACNYNLTLSAGNGRSVATRRIFDSDSFGVLQHHAMRERLGDHCQVRALHSGTQIGDGCTAAAAVTNG